MARSRLSLAVELRDWGFSPSTVRPLPYRTPPAAFCSSAALPA